MNHETALSKAREIADSVLAPAARQNDNEAEKSDPLRAFGCRQPAVKRWNRNSQIARHFLRRYPTY